MADANAVPEGELPAEMTDLYGVWVHDDGEQVRALEFAPLGQFNMPVALRTNVTGNLEAPATVFWNVKKN